MTSAEPEHRKTTVAISGAGGAVGYGLVFRIAAGGMFGAHHQVSLRLLEHAERMQRLKATAMELFDCAFPLLDSYHVTSDPVDAFSDADWIILLADSPRESARISREEQIRRNGELYAEHGRAINVASPRARILVVASPSNIQCAIAMKYAPNVPQEHWFALNRLDRMRAVALIAEKAGVPVSKVTRVNVWGNHSELLYVDFHNAFIDDQPAYEVIRDEHWAQTTLQEFVHRRAEDILNLRGLSAVATASQAILGTVNSFVTPTPFGHRFGAGVVSDGSYDVPKGLVFGFPLRTEDGKMWSIVPDLFLTDFAEERIAANIAQIEKEMVIVESLFG
ncbi:MAG TPA: malate dehydrogenase [Pirellulales bacterium]|jgi:malate dehydrogenase|nr:malate dehydrogenase [Pirellulales bacterium]